MKDLSSVKTAKKTGRTVGIIASLIVIGTAVGLTVHFVKKARNKKRAGEIDTLLTIAKNEGKMSPSDYQKYRKLMYIQDYALPATLQSAFNSVKGLLVNAGNSIRNGYAVSAMQYFNDIKARMQSENVQIRNMYNTVQNLLAEAFKLNATNTNTQEQLNSSKKKSESVWQSLLYLNPIGIVYNAASGYTQGQWEDAKKFFQEQTSDLLQENITFNKKLLAQDFDTLKLFSEAYSALSGGKDYFAIQKYPKQ